MYIYIYIYIFIHWKSAGMLRTSFRDPGVFVHMSGAWGVCWCRTWGLVDSKVDVPVGDGAAPSTSPTP